MKRCVSLATVMLVLILGPSAGAFSPEARGTGLGGAYPQFAGGAEGLYWNPGVLGQPLLASAVVGAGFEGGNNALGFERIYGIIRDQDAAKTKAVKDIRTAGVWKARIESAGLAAASVWGIGVAVVPHTLIVADKVTPDAAEYALTGAIPFETGRHYVIAGEYVHAVYTEIAVGYAHELPTFIPAISLSAGAALKYFTGTDYTLIKVNQDFTTGPGPLPASDSEHTTASAGTGVGVDLGLYASLLGTIKVGVAARNLGAGITWDKPVRQVGYFDRSTMTFTYTTPATDSIKQTLASSVLAGVGGSIPLIGTSVGASVDMDTTNKETRFHLGAEQSIVGILAFRAGYVTAAGAAPAQVTAGFGVGAVIVHADLAAGYALDGKGGSASASVNVNF